MSSLQCYCYLISVFRDPRIFDTLAENEKNFNIIENQLISEGDNKYKESDRLKKNLND